jgi:pimeloyl-ACP methyl ester carboxylesterase
MAKVHEGRTILLDQRGHGLSDHAASYERSDYVEDLRYLIAELGLSRPIIFGFSLGGANAYQYAATYGNVSKLIIEDIGTKIDGSNEFILGLPETFDSIWDVHQAFEALGRPLTPAFAESLTYDGTKWKFRFDYADIVESQRRLNGDYRDDWKKIRCPVLLMHGGRSPVTTIENMKEMKAANAKVSLVIFENAGHAIHNDDRDAFCEAIRRFLSPG